MNHRFVKTVLALAILATVAPLHAQSILGSISGTVADVSGATVGKATIVAKNKATNLKVTAATEDNGLFQIPNLPIGSYSVTISKEGFEVEEHTELLVQANQTTTISAVLKPGSVSSKVEVTATPLMNDVDISTGYTLDTQMIEQTPLGTGSFTQLAILSPGVNADFLGSSGTNAGLGNQAIWANGRPDTSNTIIVNGMNASNLFNGKTASSVDSTRFTSNTGQHGLSGGIQQTNTSVYDAIGESIPTPAPESIQEIKVTTSMYDASQGIHSGAQIQVITKSGSNEFHGQVYDYFQNNIFNAAPFFYNSIPRNSNTAVTLGPAVPVLRRNQYGANLGGPIIKNKLFFFAAYQGIQATDGLNGTGTLTVPPDLTSDRSPAALASMLQKDFGVNLSPSALDPVAVALFSMKLPNGQFLIPNPNITDPSVVASRQYNVFEQSAGTLALNQGLIDVDYNFSDKDRLSVKYLGQDNPASSPFAASSIPGFTQTLAAGAHDATIDNTTILTAHLTWEQRAGFIRERAFASTANPLTPASVGINLFGLSNFPGLSISTANAAINRGFTIGTTSNFGNTGAFQNQWDYSTTLNWVTGRHTIFAGVNFDPTQLNIVNLNNEVAKLAATTVAALFQGQIRTGTSSEFFNGASNRYYRANQIGAFVQDSWRFRPHLSFTLGLRYDYNGPLWEKYGRLTNFDPSQYQYNASTDTITNTGIVFAGNNHDFHTPGESNSTMKANQWGFAPRIGVAWNPNGGKFTVRTGFGIYYDRGEYFTLFSPGAGSGNNGPFGVTLAPPFVQIIPAATTATLANPFGTTAPTPPTVSPATFTSLFPNAAALATGATTFLFGGYDPNNRLPYTENWTFDIQWQPNNSYLFNIGYIGNHGVHEVMPIPFNQPGIATASNPIHGQTTSYGFNVVPSENLKTFDGGNTDLRVPYIGLSNNSVFYEAEGISNYNALVFGVRKRLSKGLQLFGSYTWSHTLDEQSGLGLFFNGNDPSNPRSSYATSTYDRTHVFSLAYHYDIPTPGVNGAFAKALLAGWSLSGLTIAQSGQPYNPADFSGSVGGIYYSNFVEIVDPIVPLKPGVTVAQATLQGTFGINPNKPSLDPNAFAIPSIAAGTNGVPAGDNLETGFGTGSRNAWRAPFQLRFDMSLGKEFRATERIKVRYQFDAFNVFNHPSFDAPNSFISLYNGNNPPTAASIASTTLGQTSHTLGSPRFLQMSLRVLF
jgi:hypothetical protein